VEKMRKEYQETKFYKFDTGVAKQPHTRKRAATQWESEQKAKSKYNRFQSSAKKKSGQNACGKTKKLTRENEDNSWKKSTFRDIHSLSTKRSDHTYQTCRRVRV
jgi:hypothetical protein